MAKATPPVPSNSNTLNFIGSPPLFGVHEISRVPESGTTKSVALYWKNRIGKTNVIYLLSKIRGNPMKVKSISS